MKIFESERDAVTGCRRILRSEEVRDLCFGTIFFFSLSNATTCPCGLRGPPYWAWRQCNRLLKLGRP